VTLRGRGDEGQAGTWVQSYSHENDLKFSEKVGIFPDMGVSLKNDLKFSASLLMQLPLEFISECMAIACPVRPITRH